MKTKLLKDLRAQARRRIGVFKYNGKYMVVHDPTILGDVSDFDPKDPDGEYQILEQGIEDKKDAILLCDAYRRRFIMGRVNEMKYGNRRRIY